ncbi:MAG: nitroreductase family protein [Bryobacteraceae bacterium]|jgi:nitroreductase
MAKSLIALLLVPLGLISGQELKPVALPAPQTSGGRPLMQVLKERKSVREFGPEQISRQTLANLLWAAWGINREDGRRTAPSASNRQEIEVYVITADGAYIYDAKANALKPVVRTDIRKLAGTQAYVADAPVNLVYVADTAKLGGDDPGKLATANADTGFIAQNVYLFCASEGLGTVVRGSVDRASLGKGLNLRAEQRIILAQSVGYARKAGGN